jgi:ribosomal protein S18 acetylase RimI-like enzyme
MCHGAFSHGRFHRDFNLSKVQADQRYDKWLMQLHGAGKVYGVCYRGKLAAFIAVDGNKLVLHAVDSSMRGRGLAKYLWTPVCRMLFEAGHLEVTSSVSASNLAVLNLYSRLGFSFRNPVDIYHRLTS